MREIYFNVGFVVILIISLGMVPVYSERPGPVQPYDGIAVSEEVYGSESSEMPSLIEKGPLADSRAYGIAGAADRLVETQCLAQCGGKGWGWPLACPPPESVPANTLGPAGIGLLKGYEITDDIDHLIGGFNAGDYAKCYTYPTGQFRLATFTPYFLWYITELIPGATSYRNHAQINYFQTLEAGTYGPPTSPSCPQCPYDTTEYLTSMWSARSSEYCNIRAYDATLLPKAASHLASEPQYSLFLTHMQDVLNQLDRSKYWDVQALACGILSIGMMNEDFDPTSGDFAHLDSILEMADELVRYQYVDGGFLWSTQFVDPYQKASWNLGTGEWYSGSANWINTALTKEVTLGITTAFSFDRKNSIRNTSGDTDRCYVEYSTDLGATWHSFPGFESGIGGCQATYTTASSSFPSLGTFHIRFRYITDPAFSGMTGACASMNPGMLIDNIVIDGVTDPCDSVNGWVVSNEDYEIDPAELVYHQSVQDTAYALMALKTADKWIYQDEINAATVFLWSMQLPAGGFETYPMSGSENSQVDGEALWALVYEPECFNDGDVNDSGTLTPEDAQLAFKFYLGTFPTEPTYHDFCSSDCNSSNDVTPADALCIWKHWLEGSCDCSDSLPAKRGMMSERALSPVSNGSLLKTVSFDPNTHQVILTIKFADFSAPVDSFGFSVQYPDSLEFAGSEFIGSVSEWQFIAAHPHGSSEIVVGAFDTAQSLSTDESIIKIAFDIVGPSQNPAMNLMIYDLVDDIRFFNVKPGTGIQSAELID